MREHDIVFVVFYAQAGCHEKGLPKHCGIRLHLQDSTVGTGRFLVRKTSILQSLRFQKCTNGTNMAAQQCRESERLHGIICCYIGFAFFSPCKFQTGNPFRRCALQGSLWAGLAACCHAFLARSPDTPDPGAASPKAVRQRTLFSCRERKYISSQLQWIASKCGNGKGKIKIFLW